jgi:hypothetical protein
MPNSETREDVLARMRQWLEEAVIGLNFCPFAASVYQRDRVQLVVASADTVEAAVDRTLDEAARLLETPDDEIATTLVVCPEGVSDFETFLDGAATVRHALEHSGTDAYLQVATFHPDYRFADTDPDDLGNYTNRSPYPVYHLLRESHVTEAVESHPDPGSIPDANVERLESMGREAVERLWQQWEPS